MVQDRKVVEMVSKFRSVTPTVADSPPVGFLQPWWAFRADICWKLSHLLAAPAPGWTDHPEAMGAFSWCVLCRLFGRKDSAGM